MIFSHRRMEDQISSTCSIAHKAVIQSWRWHITCFEFSESWALFLTKPYLSFLFLTLTPFVKSSHNTEENKSFKAQNTVFFFLMKCIKPEYVFSLAVCQWLLFKVIQLTCKEILLPTIMSTNPSWTWKIIAICTLSTFMSYSGLQWAPWIQSSCFWLRDEIFHCFL